MTGTGTLGRSMRIGNAAQKEVWTWHLYGECNFVDTPPIAEPSFRRSLTLTRRQSRLGAGLLALLVETSSLVASKRGVLTESTQAQADAALVELGRSLVTFGQERLRLLRSKPTTTLSKRSRSPVELGKSVA